MAESYPAPQPEGENAFWATLRQPRVVLILLAISFLVLARFALAYLEKLARREGRLTSRHQ